MAIAGKQAAHEQRCGRCGRHAVSAGVCSACGEPAVAIPPSLESQQQLQSFSAPSLAVAQSAITTDVLSPASNSTGPRQLVHMEYGTGCVRGRVIIVKTSTSEPMDFDPWRWIAIPAWGLVILILPIVVAIIAWQSLGFIGAIAVALTTFLVLRFMFSNRLLQSWYFVAALNGKNVVEMMSVVMIRLRQADDREIQLRLKGQLLGGTVIEGDRISATGRWGRGVFSVRQIFCERTGATITPKQPTALPWAIAGLCVLFFAVLWLRFAGVPWVEEQTRSIQVNRVFNTNK